MKNLRGRKRGKLVFKIKPIFFVPIFLLIVVVLFTTLSKVFEIKDVEIKLENVGCADKNQIKELLSLEKKNILFVNWIPAFAGMTKKSLESEIVSKFICIKNIKLVKKYPDIINVNIVGRKAIVAITTAKEATLSAQAINLILNESSNSATPSAVIIEPKPLLTGTKFLVDEEGVVFNLTENQGNLPLLQFIDSNIVLGKDIKSDLIKKVAVIVQKTTELNLDNRDLRIYLDRYLLIAGKPKVYFDLQKDEKLQLASLQLILDKAKIDNENMEIIDLKFDKPIVIFTPKEKK